uniref:Uncharacterized protein n=1 Tax=Arundo donax TaxID=35708 RepID=A0A0A8YSS9_ARUDO
MCPSIYLLCGLDSAAQSNCDMKCNMLAVKFITFAVCPAHKIVCHFYHFSAREISIYPNL